jgi:hypothetical protein
LLAKMRIRMRKFEGRVPGSLFRCRTRPRGPQRRLNAIDQKHPTARCREPDLQSRLVIIRAIPAASSVRIGKLDNDDPLRHRLAIEQFDLAAAGDDPAAETRNRGQRDRNVRLIGDRVGYVNFSDDLGGHSTLRIGYTV